MTRLRIGTHRFFAAAILAAACAFPGQAQVKLEPTALRQAAVIALQNGDAATARDYADALLVRDQADVDAHLIRARALRDIGALTEARKAARTAWSLADTDPERYSTAVITAQILSSQDKRTRAQLWLRRAIENAPDARAKARAQNDFRYVRRQNKWQTQLSFTLAPNSNINNGSTRDSSQLNFQLTQALFGEEVEFALTGAARALSGLEYGFGVDTRYRLHQTNTTAHDLKLALSYRSFVLSNSAQSEAPDARGSDFAFGTLGAGYDFRKINRDGKGELTLSTSIGQTFFANARLATFVRAGVAQSIKLDPQTKLHFALDLESQTGQRTNDLDTVGLSARWDKTLKSRDLAFAQVGARTTLSDNLDAEFDEVSLRAGYVLAKPVMGARVSMAVGASYRDYDVSVHSADGRQDFRVSADVTATFSQINYYGFNPTVSLSASKTNSNIGLFENNRVGLNIGIRSAF